MKYAGQVLFALWGHPPERRCGCKLLVVSYLRLSAGNACDAPDGSARQAPKGDMKGPTAVLTRLNLNVAVEFSHRVTETQRRFTAGALPQTPKAGQSQAIDWRQIIFYTLHLYTAKPMTSKSSLPCSVSLRLCVRLLYLHVAGACEAEAKR